MDRIEELLPQLDHYLRNVLAAEKLSVLAEKRRKYYVQRLDVIKFNPPSLPPRPDGGLIKIPPGGAADIPNNISSQAPVGEQAEDVKAVRSISHEEAEQLENVYADMEDGGSSITTPVQPSSDMLYLAPADSNQTTSLPTDTQQSWSDSDGTSYESYGEEEENTYDNIDTPEEVPLPRISKKKKKKKDSEPELYINDLSDILFRGELYHKGSWQWFKRYCVISNNRLLVYKNEKAPRPLINIVLLGYSIVYLEKEGRRNNVIRISHPGCESLFLGADLKEIADMWIEALNTAACVEASHSGDSANISGGSTAADQHSTSTGSEGGSGDGVVSPNTQQQRSPKSGDEKKQAADKKVKNIITDFLSGTFGKKKSQKLSKKMLDISEIAADPQARMSGVLDVCHETLTKNSWSTRYCCIKDGQLVCYHENASDGVQLALSLIGVDIQSASKETKKDLAIKLLWSKDNYILLDCSDTIEQGRWLHALIMEREGVKDATDVVYENQDVSSQIPSGQVEGDSVYDEVYDVKITTGKGEKIDEKTAHALSQLKSFNISSCEYIDCSAVVERSSSNVSDSSVKSNVSLPPLPLTDPPKRPLPIKKRRSRIEDEDGVIYDETEVGLSEEMATAFTHIKTQLEEGGSSKDGLQRTADVKKSGKALEEPKHETKNIVKCHLGPTIAEDKDLLETTRNSILCILRQEKSKGSINAEALNEQIDSLKQQLIKFKKQKSELRSKILTSRGIREKQRLEEEFQSAEQMVENLEHEITKLQLLAQEKSASSVSRSSSCSSSRSNSFRSDSMKDSLNSSVWSKKGTGSQASKPSTNGSKNTSPKKSKMERTISVTKTTTAAVMSKSWAKSSKSTSSTTKQAIARYDSSPTKQSTSLTTSPLNNGRKGTQTVHTSTTNVRSGSSQGQRSEIKTGQKQNGKSSPFKDSDSTKPHKIVKEKLKLWESIAESSNS